MKKRSVISVLLAAILLLLLCGCSDDAPKPTIAQNSADIRLDLTLPESVQLDEPSESLALLKMPIDTERAKAEVEACFGIELDEAEKSTTENFEYYTTADYSVMIDLENGYWTYDVPQTAPQAGALISDEDAMAKATDFVEENELWSGEWNSVKVVSQSGLNAENEYGVTLKSVYFYPEVDGLAVLGIFRISVDVDMEGRIVAVFKQLREPDGAVSTALKSRSEIAQSIEDGEYSAGASQELQNVEITAGEYCYYADARGADGCTYLYPACVFSAQGIAEDGTTETFDIILSAQK